MSKKRVRSATPGTAQCEKSPSNTSRVTTRDVFTPNGKNVTGRQLEVPTPNGEHRAFHHIVPLEASELERNRLELQDMQADRNARRKAKRNTETNNERGQVSAKRRALYQEKNDREEKWLLAYAHEHGIRGVEVDEAKALKHYEDAAKLGDPDAMTKLALAYSTGEDLGVEEDKKNSLKFYEKAAALQDHDAQAILAMAYEEGDFGEVDKVKALGLYALAAGNGDPGVLLRLAKAHSPGGDLGVEVDDAKVIELKAKALEVFRLEAKHGDPGALFRLAKAHLPGGYIGVEAGDGTAIEIFKEVAALLPMRYRGSKQPAVMRVQ